MKSNRLFQFSVRVLQTAIFSLFLASSASAGWYGAELVQLTTRMNTGDVVVQFKPAPGVTSYQGTVRGILLGSEPGTSKILAEMLTAITLGSIVQIEMANVPTWQPAQAITGMGMVVPTP